MTTRYRQSAAADLCEDGHADGTAREEGRWQYLPTGSGRRCSSGWPDPHEPADAVLDLYRQEIAASDAVLARLDLNTPPARWPDYFEHWRLRDLREIILHVITETAVHAGHLDAARELLDGRTWTGPEETRIPRG